MDLINKFLNLIVPPLTIFTLIFLLPPFLFLKFCKYIIRFIFPEDLTGKVVLITGASSGIGEHLAYEYAKRGACLALCARREKRLRAVSDRARNLCSPAIIAIRADVSKADECKRIVDQTVNYFGRLDHLVNNAGVVSVCMFEEVDDVDDFKSVMDINFWGYVYTTRFALPHLKNSNGKIVVVSSVASWLVEPRMSFYIASKAAISQFFETLRVELSNVRITLVTPGFIESEMTRGKFLAKGGELQVDQDLMDVQLNLLPVGNVEECAKAIVNSAARGESYLTEPSWYRVTLLFKLLCPEVLEWCTRMLYMSGTGKSPKDVLGKKIPNYTEVKYNLHMDAIKNPETKTK